MSLIAARWILSMDRPALGRGWIEVHNHRIVGLHEGTPPPGATNLGDAVLMPGLVNAHTHLELSWLAGVIAPAESFTGWVRAIIATRSDTSVSAAERARAMRQAADDMRRTGTVAIGDVSNTLASIPVIRESGLAGRVFHELIGFNVAAPRTAVADAWSTIDAVAGQEAGDPLISVAAHAPYSVSPELFSEIARQHRGGPLSVHLAESAEEMEFIRHGTGPLRQLLGDLGVWRSSWVPPGCDPAEYLARLGYLRAGMLAVHAAHLTASGLEYLRDAGAIIVTCPRSNEWVGAGMPPVARYYGSGVPVAIGTDSLASVRSLNLFDELAEIRRVAPEVSAASLLESATRIGARALGLDQDFGTLAVGKRAEVVSVNVPEGERDVEEYLVSGVPPSAVRLLAL